MNFDFTEEQLMIQQTAKEFAEAEIAPSSIERDINAEFPHEIIKKLGELGFLGMMVSPDYGGAGMDTVSYVLAMMEISKVDASCGVIMSVNNSLVTWGLETYGSDFIKQKYLIPLAKGEKLGAFALSEPEAGSDATNQHTLAHREGDFFVLDGIKNWITNGRNADYYLVMAQTEVEKKHKGITTFLVEKGIDGFEHGKKEDKMGIRSSDTCSLIFTNCKVPVENIVWEEGKGFNFAMNTLNGGRIGIAAQALGIAVASLEASIKYAKQRKAFGTEIANHQAIQFKIAEMATKVEAAKLITMQAAALKDAHKPYVKESAMAKYYVSKIAVECALEAIQIHGGYGYVREYLVERYLRDAKITEIYEGTNEIQRIVIARSLLSEH
ncbi:MAG: acyl-CoA dehydrogenase [Ignavibacteria bacterium CG_4_8_14_3_um_filter_37_9]|nr:acyl-CoA dehydrogenase [Ignavibacteria bacterium]OIO20343.1 MAG: acyl-CoA dehydrogenase [Ignavibacteria bacterium CG1_02_37_35]PIP76369.1 MAG: acyl-CoA dehydrogenase [Ignavibacteria bacterium CG22_combo_CG10-13_8_21_14_all_37_15]PIS44957.1 MAG: acyl-CoA dehydrogenase [Ignavibacteria bacterium CG08_land_8_20_14_0_20_37_9]PIW98627.1 MAG: acyl-CoA dehydrogenase [Ignavibacteria bacterium CG_4_8_14_3_um_filter_37_9]PJC61000.1 MAG: acyl-CoA dehydrogenase [Ignavibacteria bacterium CG_4_9_14_0_2_um